MSLRPTRRDCCRRLVRRHVAVDRYGEHGLRFQWADDFLLRVREQGNEVVIEGNAAGLESLARHLLALAQTGVPSGFHLHLDAHSGLSADSAGLVLEREDDPSTYGG